MTTAAGLAMIAGMGIGLVAPAVAQAQTNSASYSIPAGGLGSALNAFADQAGLTLLYRSSVASGRSTPGILGVFGPEEALSRLLAGTGLVYRFTSASTVTIEDPSSAAAPVSDDGSIILDEIDVTAWVENAATGSGFQGTPDWVYETPSSVSVVGRDAIVAAGVRDVRDLLSNVSGAYVNASNATYPSISPNLRGLQDMGRVVVSIDGARQNASQGIASGSESYQGGSSHAYVDSAFIRSVEVNKSTKAGSGSGGSLGGSVTFRTIEAADIIDEGKNWGVELNATTGTNNHTFQGSILAAARLTDTPFSITGGFSGLSLGEYQLGQGGNLTWDGVAGTETHLMGRDNWSSLLKLEGDFGDLQTSLAWTHQEKKFSYTVGGAATMQSMKATTDTLTGNIEFDPVDNDLIDLDVTLWLNSTLTNQLRHQRTSTIGGVVRVDAPNTYIDNTLASFGVSLENTSAFDIGLGSLSVNYGIEAFRDVGSTKATSTTLDLNPTWASNYTSFYPAGIRDIASAYASSTFEPTDWLSFTAGLRYDWYRLQGTPTYYYNASYTDIVTIACDPVANHYTALQYWNAVFLPANPSWATRYTLFSNVLWPNTLSRACMPGTGTTTYNNVVSFPATTLDIDRSASALLPSATVEFTPVDWFKPYVSYSESMRPPTITEAFLAGGPPGDGAPGISYAPYDDLKAERARTWEVGANMSLDGLILEDDTLRVKAAAFSREIDNYIVVGQHYRTGSPQIYQGYMNLLDPTQMRGVELEANYDARMFWIGGSATYLETEWGQSVAVTSSGTNTTSGNVFLWSGDVPPKFKLTLDGGVRLMDERLSIGGTVTHVTPTLTHDQTFSQDGQFVTDQYTTLDLYGSFALSDNATIRASVSNVTDINYVPAGSRYPAPGRTFSLSLNAKF